MELRAIRVDLANAISSRVVYLCTEEYQRLVEAWDAGQTRYSMRHGLFQDDPRNRTWHLDLNGVVSIVPL